MFYYVYIIKTFFYFLAPVWIHSPDASTSTRYKPIGQTNKQIKTAITKNCIYLLSTYIYQKKLALLERNQLFSFTKELNCNRKRLNKWLYASTYRQMSRNEGNSAEAFPAFFGDISLLKTRGGGGAVKRGAVF